MISNHPPATCTPHSVAPTNFPFCSVSSFLSSGPSNSLGAPPNVFARANSHRYPPVWSTVTAFWSSDTHCRLLASGNVYACVRVSATVHLSPQLLLYVRERFSLHLASMPLFFHSWYNWVVLWCCQVLTILVLFTVEMLAGRSHVSYGSSWSALNAPSTSLVGERWLRNRRTNFELDCRLHSCAARK